MKLDLEHLGTDPDDFHLVLDRSSDPALYEELKLEGDLRAELKVYLISDGAYRFEGILQGSQLLTCVRTLEPFIRPFETEMVFEVVKDDSVRDQVVEDEDEELFRFRIPVLQESVDIAETVRQLVVLQEPINPVKDPSQEFTWKGPEAESDDSKALDPRWEKLQELKRKLENPGNPSKE